MLPALVPVAAVVALDPGGYAPFGPAKWWAATVLVPLAAVRCVGGAARVERATARLWLVLLAWATLCAVVGVDRWYALLGTPERHAGVLLYVLCGLAFVVGQQVDGRVVARGAAVAAVALGAWAVVELVWRAPVRIDAVANRLAGPFGSAAYLGAACCLLGPMALGVALDTASHRPWRVAGGAGAVGCTVALAGSGTRGAWLAAGAVGMVVVVTRRAWRGRALGLAAAGLVVAGASVGLLAARHDGDTPLARATPVSARADEWRVALRVISARPVSGAGPEGYRVIFPREVDAAYERAYGRVVNPDRAHDVLLDAAATLGVPGALLVLALAAVVGRSVVRVLRRGDAVGAGLAAGVLAYAAQQAVLFPLAELEPTAWLAAGVVVAIDARASARPTWRVPSGRVVRAALGAFATAALVLGALDVVADRAVRDWQRTGSAAAARRAASLRGDQVRYRLAAARAQAAAGDTAGALAELDAAARWSAGEPALRVERAQLVGTVAAWQDVLRRDPRRAAAWLQLGLAAARADDAALAREAWVRAQDLAPRDPTASLNLARLALDEGRIAEAVEALAAARRIAPADPRVAPLVAELAATGR